MKGPMTCCPRCGFDGYTYSDRAFLVYTGVFGQGEESEESEVESVQNRPKTATCGRCKKRFPLSACRG